ncbi:MAG: hypothetical protein OXC37_06580, partial [Bdellovibrionaceae bacterium]|nr:hypothetical protein [Pseudobdellovibrionaceae bacterium]
MNSKLYLRFWLFFLFSLLCVLSFSVSLYKFNSLKTKKESLKKTIKLDSFVILNKLNKKLDFFIDSIEQIKLKESLSANHPFLKLITLQKSKIEKIYLNPSAKVEIKAIELQKIIDSNFSLSTSAKNLKIQFKKIKYKDKSYIILIYLSDKDTKDIVFFKDSKPFKLSPLKKGNIHFITVTNKNKFIFYETKLKKYHREKILESFFKNNKTSNSKYITIKAKKKSPSQIYYLNKWTNTNLYLISFLENSNDISNIFFPNLKYQWILTLIFILFCISLFLFWFYLSSLISAYSFLKSALISFSKNGNLPLPPNSKNFLLYFYNNRISFLNKKKENKLEEKIENKSFTKIIKNALE